MPALFEWGTYNGYSMLEKASLLGMRLTEIPPHDFRRRSYGEGYFKRYGEKARKVFTTITAHAPYYSLVSESESTREKVKRALKDAVRKAVIAGAEVFNLHLGGKLEDVEKSIEQASEIIKELLSVDDKIYISLETTYSDKLLGSLEEIREIIEIVGSERVIPSLQLENDFMRETNAARIGFHKANTLVDEDFWRRLFRKAFSMTNKYFSLRFSQIIGVRIKGFTVKKRVPLGKGYPDTKPLLRALSKFIVHEVKGVSDVEIHLIYTGPTETKYRDTIELSYNLIQEISEQL